MITYPNRTVSSRNNAKFRAESRSISKVQVEYKLGRGRT